MKVCIDTSAFIALFVKSELSHETIVRKYREYRLARVPLFTSYYILDELLTRLRYDKREMHLTQHIHKLLDSISRGELTVLQIDDLLFHKSVEVFMKFSDQKISFTDATTYTLCKHFSLDEVFTLDSDFKKMGLPIAPHITS